MDRLHARRLAALALLLGLIAEVLFYGSALGLNLPVVVTLVLLSTWLARPNGARIDPFDRWIVPAAVAFAAAVALRADSALVTLDVLLALALTVAGAAALSGAAITRRSATGVIDVSVRAFARVCAGPAAVVRAARPSALDARAALVRLSPVARGVLLAAPLVVAFGVLFASADAVFSRLMVDLLGLQIDLGDAPARFAVVLALAWLAGGMLVTGREGPIAPAPGRGAQGAPTPKPADAAPFAADVRRTTATSSASPWTPVPWAAPSGGPAAAGRPSGGWAAAAAPSAELSLPPVVALPRLGVTEAAVAIAIVDALFALFVGLQVAYLFGARDTLAATGVTYSDYARRGFFELVAAAALSGALIATIDRAVAARSRAFLVLALTLVALTGVVLVSAALRLRLYQEAYGWTELRFYVYAAIGWLGLGLAALAALLGRDRMRWLAHALGVAALVVVVALNAIGPTAFVAERNLERALDPRLIPSGGKAGLDAAYAAVLSDDAIPAIAAALPSLAPADRSILEPALRLRWTELRTDPAFSAPGAWNLARDRARAALDRMFGG